MKLRQKLAMVLASAMIVTAIPVTTMAQSVNLNKPSFPIIGGSAITTTQALSLVINYDYAIPADETEVFYVKATDFKFSEEDYKYINAQIKAGSTAYGTIKGIVWSEEELEVTAVSGKDKVFVPIAGTPKKDGAPVIEIKASTGYTENAKIVLGGETISSKSLMVTAGDVTGYKVDATSVTFADIAVEEKVAGEFATARKITVKLPNSSDLKFRDCTVDVKGSQGVSLTGTVDAKATDDKTLEITLPTTTTKRPGKITLSNVVAYPESKKDDLKLGEVKVTVKGDQLDDTTLTVAKVVEEDVDFKQVGDKVTFTAGAKAKDVKVKFEETTKGTIGTKAIYLTVEGANFEKVDAKDLPDGCTWSDAEKKDEIEILDPTKVEGKELTFKIEAAAKAEGDVTIVASGRGLVEDKELNVGTVEKAFTVETESIKIETGIKNQKGGKIVITEAKEGKIGKKQFRIKADDKALEIEKATVKVTDGDLKIDNIEVENGEIIFDVTRTSDEASEITISDIEMTASKYIAEGNYNFLVGGEAVSYKNVKDTEAKNEYYQDALELKDFVTTADAKKTVELGEGADVYFNEDNRMMAKLRTIGEIVDAEPSFAHVDGVGVITFFKEGKLVQFTNGSNIMNINGVAVPMDTKTVIKEDNYTYVPARYLAEALGLTVDWNPETRVATFTTK